MKTMIALMGIVAGLMLSVSTDLYAVIVANGKSANALGANGLTQNGWTSNGLSENNITNPLARLAANPLAREK